MGWVSLCLFGVFFGLTKMPSGTFRLLCLYISGGSSTSVMQEGVRIKKLGCFDTLKPVSFCSVN